MKALIEKIFPDTCISASIYDMTAYESYAEIYAMNPKNMRANLQKRFDIDIGENTVVGLENLWPYSSTDCSAISKKNGHTYKAIFVRLINKSSKKNRIEDE